MKILVTGGAGFIGSHVVDMLIEENHEVHVIDNLSTGVKSNLHEDAIFHEIDIRSDEVFELWEQERFEIMVHLAAQMNVRKSVEDPRFDADVNLLGMINLMEAGRKSGLKRVVFSSTGGAAYDDNVPFPTPETSPARPVSPYGIGKMATELYLNYYNKEYGIEYTALRLGNVYGPRQNPHGEAGVVSIFVERLLKGEKAIINGDGLQTRDYVFCKDVARAINLAINSNVVDYFNVGTSIETNVVDLFHAIKKSTSSNFPEKHGESMPGEVRRSSLDYNKIKKALQWKPLVSFSDGIAMTVEYFRRKLKDSSAR